MRPGNLLVLLLALAVIATASWFLLRDDDGGGVAPLTAEETAEDASDAEASTGAMGEGEEVDHPGSSERSEVVAADASAAKRREDCGVVHGHVVDANGAPVADARVFVASSDFWVSRAAMLDPEATPKRLKDAPVVRTAADGSFELVPHSPDDALRVTVLGATHVPKSVEVPATAGATVDVGEIRVEIGVLVTGRVVDLAGRAIESARVVSRKNRSFSDYWSRNAENGAPTDEDGRFRLVLTQIGEHELIARHEDYADGTVTVAPTARGARIDGVTIGLGEGAAISGRVRGAPSDAKLEVRASATKAPDVGDALENSYIVFALNGRPEFARHVTKVEDDGGFELRGLAAGQQYKLFVVPEEQRSRSVCAPVEVESGTRGLEIPYGTGLSVAFRAVDAQSKTQVAAVEATVSVRSPKDEGAFNVFYVPPDKRDLTADDDGRFVIDSVKNDGPNQKLNLTVRALGYRRTKLQDVVLPLRGELDLGTIELEPAPTVRVEVRDAEGQPVEGVEVAFRVPTKRRAREAVMDSPLPMDPSASKGWRQVDTDAETDEEGIATFTVETAKKIRLTATHEGFAPYESRALEMPENGRLEHAVLMTEGGTLDVLVVDTHGETVQNVNVTIQAVLDGETRTVRNSGTETTNAKGHAVFEHLAACEYTVKIGSEDGVYHHWRDTDTEADPTKETTVVIEDGRRVEISLTREIRSSLSGVVSVNGFPVEGARVRVGGAEGINYLMPEEYGSGVKTDSAGRFELEDLALGELTFAVYHRSRAMPKEYVATIVEGGTVMNVALSATTVRGRVVDENGAPVVGANVTAVRAERGEDAGGEVMLWASAGGFVSAMDGKGGAAVKTDVNGDYELEGVESGRPVRVSVSSDKHLDVRSEPFTLANDSATQNGVDFTVQGAGSIQVQVNTGGGLVMVTAQFEGEGAKPSDSSNSFARNGKVRLDSLRPGPWKLSVMGSNEIEPKTVEVVAGETATVDMRK